MALYRDTVLPNVRAGVASVPKPAGYAMMMEIRLSFETDRTQALETTRHGAKLALSAAERHGIEDPAELQRRADTLPLERAASRWIVTDDPDEVVARVMPYVRLCLTHLVVPASGPDQARFLDPLAARVAPRLRAAA